MMRRAFTVVEMLIAVGLSVVVAAEMTVVVTSLFRLEREKMWNVEFAQKLRVAREYVLFRAKPFETTEEGVSYFGGFLGASNILWKGSQLAANLQRSADGRADSFDDAPFNLTEEMGGRFAIKGMDDGEQALQTGDEGRITNSIAFLSIEAELLTHGQRTNRIERIAIPVGSDGGDEAPWLPFIKVTEIGWK